MIKIDFEIQNEKYGVYRDALYLAEDHGLSDAEIEAMKQERYDNWLDAVENPPVVEEVTPVVEENPDDYIEINGVKYKKVVE
jgi:hypothetical protein